MPRSYSRFAAARFARFAHLHEHVCEAVAPRNILFGLESGEIDEGLERTGSQLLAAWRRCSVDEVTEEEAKVVSVAGPQTGRDGKEELALPGAVGVCLGCRGTGSAEGVGLAVSAAESQVSGAVAAVAGG